MIITISIFLNLVKNYWLVAIALQNPQKTKFFERGRQMSEQLILDNLSYFSERFLATKLSDYDAIEKLKIDEKLKTPLKIAYVIFKYGVLMDRDNIATKTELSRIVVAKYIQVFLRIDLIKLMDFEGNKRYLFIQR